ncbi:hypothetical protein IFM89_025823 [Coptis chinensis]|uniref:PAZ domain-containing protein n=1 Tax=Coptis chinensis TaxID=261450 RepID=A0A835LJG1_9MAGN|nr:hypothetical protein IFM89_025823 [Coptis chinensis]
MLPPQQFDDDAASMDSVLCVSRSRLLKKGFTQNDCTGDLPHAVKFGYNHESKPKMLLEVGSSHIKSSTLTPSCDLDLRKSSIVTSDPEATSRTNQTLWFTVDECGQRMSVAQYFHDKYDAKLRYGHWPALQAGSDSKPSYFPMEVCKIVEGQRYSKKLNVKQVTNMLRASC